MSFPRLKSSPYVESNFSHSPYKSYFEIFLPRPQIRGEVKVQTVLEQYDLDGNISKICQSFFFWEGGSRRVKGSYYKKVAG